MFHQRRPKLLGMPRPVRFKGFPVPVSDRLFLFFLYFHPFIDKERKNYYGKY
nr:MAG TPA: hypothetical protein [Bacteriophage sp.]